MKKVITYGTFDLFHQGHYNIIKRAKEYGDYLIVGVTSESFDIERGKLNVKDSLLKRIENVKNTGMVDEIIIEEYQGQKVDDIIKHNVDTFVIGSDWIGKFDYLKNYCDVKYLERTKNISSTMLRTKGLIYRVGIITDDDRDSSLIEESRSVSGIHVESVFCEDREMAKNFCEKYELDTYEDDFEKFVAGVDIVYVRTVLEKRAQYIDRALEHGKHVISDSPAAMDEDVLRGFFKKAKENQVLLVEKTMLAYLRAFHQLVWIARGDMMGEIVGIRCAISRRAFGANKTIEEIAAHALCAVLKLLGREYREVRSETVRDADGNRIYDVLSMKYDNALATIEIGMDVNVENELVVIGKKGRITVPNDWWNTGYFEAKVEGAEFLKRFSFNFEGTGFRYLLQELLIMISDRRTECTRLFSEESLAIVSILNSMIEK